VTTKTERRAAERPGKDSRHRARETALQMLYQWEVGRTSVSDVLRTFWLHQESERAGLSDELRAFAVRLTMGVSDAVGNIDPLIVESAEHWRLERMNVVDRLILRLAIYEFLHEDETPARVIINEALELARTFSGDDSVRFINGVLDAVRRRLGRE
jgi:N utilization substance protein B